jgi:hypothetical protein
MRDVSPVDDNRGQSASNVPVLRKAPPVIQTGEVNPPNKFWGIKLAPNSKVKWDEYSGEPTSSKAGRAGQVNPGTYAKETVRPRPQLGYQVSVSGPESKKKAASIAARFAMRSTPTENVTAPAENVTAHEPWGQPTGRSQITPPLRDEATRNPLQFPKTSGSRALEVLDWDSSNALAISVNHGQTTADTRHVPNDLRYLDTQNNPIKPVVPLKVEKRISRPGVTSPISPISTGLGISSLPDPRPITPPTQKQQQPEADRSYSQGQATPTQSSVTDSYLKQTPDNDKEAPASRFSWTTYNTHTTYQHSPPLTPPQPPLPTSFPVTRDHRVVTEPISAASSILNRRRPVPTADKVSESPTTQKPASSAKSPGSVTRQNMAVSARPSSPGADSTFSTATSGTQKALPQPPTTLSACDHLSVLESQMEDLRVRRSNVYRLLSDLNNAAPANPLLTDFKRARMAEQRKRMFEDELTEIKSEEHEVGLKLHRAWKKREIDDPNHGSALWIRRVTS